MAPAFANEEALHRFAELVTSWRARTDLTSARDAEAIEEVLFLDARVLAEPGLVPEGARVVDVGAGAGAPSIPLALLRPDVDVTLVEPRRRRVAFLRTAVGSLGLERRARVVEARVDGRAPRIAGMPFDVALSRATFPPERWVAIGGALAAGVLVMTAASEPPPAPDGWSIDARRDYQVPRTGAPRAVTLYGVRPARARRRDPAAPPE